MPYRGIPVYNTKRRLTSLTSTLARRRSVSQSSMCSINSEYGTPKIIRQPSQVTTFKQTLIFFFFGLRTYFFIGLGVIFFLFCSGLRER